MLNRGRPTKEIIAELSERMNDPQQLDAALEWVRRLAARDSKELLRGVIEVLVGHIEQPPQRRRGRPTKAGSSITVDADGIFTMDLTASPLLTKAEASRQFCEKLRDFEIFEKVQELTKRFTVVGAIQAAARQMKLTEAKTRNAYYRVKNSP